MHQEAYDWVRGFVLHSRIPDSVLEIGARNVNGSVRALFHSDDTDYMGIDVAPGSGVDVVADGACYLSPSPVDLVICCEVLEHTPRSPEIVMNAARNLEEHGVLLLTCATEPRAPHSAVDGCALQDGEFYHNVSPPELALWMHIAGFREIHTVVDPERGDLYAVARK